MIPDPGMKLAGAECDFTEPATGQNKLFFPVACVDQIPSWKKVFFCGIILPEKTLDKAGNVCYNSYHPDRIYVL